MNTISNRTFGIELEVIGVASEIIAEQARAAGLNIKVETYNHNTRPGWKIVPDGSIRGGYGCEIVSPVLSGEAGLAQIRTLCAVLARLGVKVNKTCGFHVHHNARDLSLGGWKCLFKKYITNEGLIDNFMPKSRRASGNTFCLSLRARFTDLSEAYRKIGRATTLESLFNIATGYTDHANRHTMGRYYKLNLAAFWQHGTVEFRHHSATVEADKIIAWVIFTQYLVEDAAKEPHMTVVRAADSINGLFFKVPDAQVRAQLKNFYEGRIKTHARRAARQTGIAA